MAVTDADIDKETARLMSTAAPGLTYDVLRRRVASVLSSNAAANRDPGIAQPVARHLTGGAGTTVGGYPTLSSIAGGGGVGSSGISGGGGGGGMSSGGGGGSLGAVTGAAGAVGTGAGAEVNAAAQANQMALDQSKAAAGRSGTLFNEAIPGLRNLSNQFYEPALAGNFQGTPLGRNMQLEIMRQMEKAKNRQRVSAAASGRSAQETDALLGGIDTAAAQSLAAVPLAGLNQAQGYYTGLASLAQGISPTNVNVQTPGITLAGLETPLATNYASQYGYGTSLADLPYYLQ